MSGLRKRQALLLATLIFAAMLNSGAPKSPNSELANVLHRSIRTLEFPDNSAIGYFIALAIPLAEPYELISLADFFEAVYNLPPTFSDDPGLSAYSRRKRNLDRAAVYQIVESKFLNYGYQGHECLLRAICETSEHSLRHNGLIGDILHVIFTPTSSRQERLPQDILQAEVVGRNGSCSNYRPQCPVGLFDLIGVLG